MKFIVLGSVVLILLSVATALAPNVFTFSPLGGSAIAEMGIVLGFAVAVATVIDLFRREHK